MAVKTDLKAELKNYFGFDNFKGNQEAIIENLMAGNDTFVLMPTGGGKSLCYQLPSLLMDGTAIVISPLIALMKNQVDAMRNFGEDDGIAHFLNSSLNRAAIEKVKSDIVSGKTKLLYVAPESLTKEENIEFLSTVSISFYAVDEAHCISEWGHDFRPEYRRIRPLINQIGNRPVIALTATATPKVQHDIQKNLGMLDAKVFKSSFNRPNLYYEVRPKTKNVDKDIIKLEKFVITGGKPLHGEVIISGAKNAAVGILPATILAADVCVIENLPDISDVAVSLKILSVLGAKVRMLNKNTYEIDTTHLTGTNVPDDLSRQMRASYYFLGALLSRFGKAEVAMPGGCNLGPRPIDQHLKVFSALGAEDSVDYGMITVHADELNGAHIFFDKVSVGATMNGMLSAVMAKGQTILENCAKEPHVVDLANFLNMCGADVRGAGTDVIKVRGVEQMHGCTYSIIPDQIEAGSYMVAAAATGGDVLVKNVTPKHLEPITAKLRRAGIEVEEFDDAVRVRRTGDILPLKINTMPHPGFPTDMQPLMGVLLSVAKGTSTVTESVWDNRFRYVDELRKMGANVQVDGQVAVFEGVEKLSPAPLRASDLRAGAAMVVAALMADGTSEIEEIGHIERGYENIVEKLRGLGADIRKVERMPAALEQAL